MARVLPLPVRLGAALASVLLGGCTHTVVAPPTPREPVAAFLLDHGRHASLVLQREGGLTRYTYGHWRYFALNETGPLRASGTLFGSNAAGLGRRPVPADPELASVRRGVRVVIQHAWEIEVPRARARDLARRFERIFRAGADERIHNRLYDLEFVPHPEPYHVGNNSNHMTGRWLRALGCRVELRGPFSGWRVEGAVDGPPDPD